MKVGKRMMTKMNQTSTNKRTCPSSDDVITSCAHESSPVCAAQEKVQCPHLYSVIQVQSCCVLIEDGVYNGSTITVLRI